MPEQDILNILTNFKGDFSIVDIAGFVLRSVGWFFIQLFAMLSNGMESVMDKIYTLNNFFDSEGVKDFIKSFYPLIFVILGISIVYVGYKLITDREFKSEKLVNNITLSVMVIMLLPTLMLELNEATSNGISAVKGGKDLVASTNANEIIKANLTDLYYLDSKDFKVEDKKNNIPLEIVGSININEEISDKKVKNKDVFKNKVTTTIDGEQKVEKLDKGIFGIGKENYFRYNFNFWIISISILCTTLVLLLTSLKVGRLIYELGFIKVFAIFYAFADIGNGNGIRQIIKHILSVFAIIFTTSVLLKLYTLFSGFISSSDANSVVKMILLVSSSIAVIDAPNIVERIFGIDAGLKSAWGVIVGANSALETAGKMGQLASKVGDSIAGAGAGVAGMTKGFLGGGVDGNIGNDGNSVKPLEEQMNEGNSNSMNPLEDDENSKKSSESVNMADNISSLDEDKNTSTSGLNSNQSENLDRNSNDLSSNNIDTNLDSNDINDNINGSLSQNNSIGEDYGARSSLSEDMETQNISSGNIDNTQGVDNITSSNSPIGNINDTTSSTNTEPLDSQMSNGSHSANISDIEDSNTPPNNAYNSSLENGANKPNMLDDKSNNNSINKDNSNIQQDSKPNISSDSKNSNGDKKENVSNGNKPIETRTYGEYSRDKFRASKPVNIANQHYQLGQNTGIKLRQKYDRVRSVMREENSKIK